MFLLAVLIRVRNSKGNVLSAVSRRILVSMICYSFFRYHK